MIDIHLDDRELKQALDRLQRRLADMTPVMRAIATELEARASNRFETETGPDGKPWPQLADSTLMNVMRRAAGGDPRKQRGGGTKAKAIGALARKRILYDTGDLLDNLASDAGRDWAAVGVGGSVRYAAIHQFGGKAGRGKNVTIPARPFLPVTSSGQWLGDADRRAVLDILREALESAANPHG